ncbi:hypothetical protein SAMN05216383_10999, partial [Prevotella sp. KH2C16]
INLTAFCETIRLKVMPLFFTSVILVKIDMEKDTLITSLFNNACVVFTNVCHVKELKYTFGKKVTGQNLVIKCCLLTHGCKVNASHELLSIKQENIGLYYKIMPRIFATVPIKLLFRINIVKLNL